MSFWPFKKRILTKFVLLANQLIGRTQWHNRSYTQLALEGYKKNVIAFRCISLIARGVSSLPWFTRVNDKEVDKHALTKLMAQPNPTQGGAIFVEALMSYWLISGNSYTRAIGPDTGPPTELWNLRPDLTRVVGVNGIPVGYAYRTAAGERMFPFDMSKVKNSEILHVKSFNPLDSFYGMSRLEAAAAAIDQHNAAGDWNYSLLRNGASPSGIMTYTAKEGMPSMLSPSEYDQIAEQIQEGHKGPKRAGKMMFLNGNLAYQQTSLSPKDMDFLNAKNTSARDVAAAYNIPPMMVGIVGDATFANYAEARLAAWEDEILIDAIMLRAELNRWLAPKFGPNVMVDFDADNVPALATRSQILWEKLSKATFLTIDEKREAAGYDPLPEGGDVVLPVVATPPNGTQN